MTSNTKNILFLFGAVIILVAMLLWWAQTDKEEDSAPPTRAEETYRQVEPGEAYAVLQAENLTSASWTGDVQDVVKDWMDSCHDQGRAGIGMYVLCHRADQGDMTAWTWLVMRVSPEGSYTHALDVSRGEKDYHVRMTYRQEGENAQGADDCLLITGLFPTGEVPVLDFIEDGEDLPVLITYTEQTFWE